MYRSLIPWCKQLVTVHHAGSYLPSGEVAEDEVYTLKCFWVNDSRLFTDDNGLLQTCRSYAYVIPEEGKVIEKEDLIELPGSTKKYSIRKLGGYFDGNDGQLSVQVVYV